MPFSTSGFVKFYGFPDFLSVQLLRHQSHCFALLCAFFVSARRNVNSYPLAVEVKGIVYRYVLPILRFPVLEMHQYFLKQIFIFHTLSPVILQSVN